MASTKDMTFDKRLLAHTAYEPLLAKMPEHAHRDQFTLYPSDLTDEMVDAVFEMVTAAEDKPQARVWGAIQAARRGEFNKPIPRLSAASEMLLAYFRANLRDGWVYKRAADGHLHAWLVTNVEPKSHQSGEMFVQISMMANGRSGGASYDDDRVGKGAIGLVTTTVHLGATEVTRKRVDAVLDQQNILIETEALRAEYDKGLAIYEETLLTGFAEQFRLDGVPNDLNYRKPQGRRVHKVIHDLNKDDIRPPAEFAETVVFGEPGTTIGKKAKVVKVDDDDAADEDRGLAPVPVHFDIRVFDLVAQDFVWVNALDLTRYVYDPSLADKIVLPADQRNLLDILTSNLDDFTGDVIEGKSAGNVVLCKGEPGVGKTLTAEVYAELIERPLYSIHSGNLGINAKDIRENLETTFQRSKRWGCVLLLDEADVFVLERGSNITQNAIVAEFLRTLEYFDGLMFMTTNRASNIDDAILSRSAAIIDYAIPDRDGIREVWKVQGRNQNVTLPDPLLDDLVGGFKHITPRDVKMLLRLSLRVAASEGGTLTTDIVARCAMFRGLHFEPGSRGQA